MSIESRTKAYGTVFEHWRVGRKLGHGSGGKTAVFELSRNDSFRESCALKVISLIEETGRYEDRPVYMQEEYQTALEACKKKAVPELQMMLSLRGNTNVVDYLDHKFQNWSDETGFGCDLLVRMELLEDLRGIIKRKPRLFSEREILKIGTDICTALALCHENGIVHRDIKPENIFVNEKGDYKLGDFGVSRLLDAAPSAVATTGIGTPEYAAPEQFVGAHDRRVDIYSLGLVLYELSNRNRLPFASSTYVQLEEIQKRQMGTPLVRPSEASDELWEVIRKACAHKASDRYDNAREFLNALSRVDGDNPVKPAGVGGGGFQKITPYESGSTGYGTRPANVDTGSGYGTRPANVDTGSGYGTRPANVETGSGYGTRPADVDTGSGYGTRPANVDTGYGTRPADPNPGGRNRGSNQSKKTSKGALIAAAAVLAAVILGGGGLLLAKLLPDKAPEENPPAHVESVAPSVQDPVNPPAQEPEKEPAQETKPAPVAISFETYQSMTDAERQAYMDSYENSSDFFAWYDAAKAEYDASHQTVETQGPVQEKPEYDTWELMKLAGSVAVGYTHRLVLLPDGTVSAAFADNTASNHRKGQCDVSGWTDLVAVAAGDFYSVGLTSYNTVLFAGYDRYNISQVENWSDVIMIAAGDEHAVGLKSDGTVVAAGNNSEGQCNTGELNSLTDECGPIIAITAGYRHTVALYSDGSVYAIGRGDQGQLDVVKWPDDVAAIYAGANFTVGLSKDGSVYIQGDQNRYDLHAAEQWSDVAFIATGDFFMIGVTNSGEVLYAGDPEPGNIYEFELSASAQINLTKRSDIAAIGAGGKMAVAVTKDGDIVDYTA